MNKKNITIGLIILVIALMLFSCSKKNDDPKYNELLNAMNNNKEDISATLEFMYYCTMNSERCKEVIDIYENNSDIKDDMMARIYYATSLSLMADQLDDVIEQVKYVRNSMNEFDTLIEDYPEVARVYMWQAITYSNYPAILGANELVISAAQKANELYLDDKNSLVKDELKQIVFALFNISKEFENKEYYDIGCKYMDDYGLTDDKDCINSKEKARKKFN